LRVLKSSYLVTFLALSVGVFLIASGCAPKPPTQEIADAEAAIAAAREAEAEVYAPEEFGSAEELLAQAKSEADDEATYREAKTHAIQAKERADLAREIALKAKAPKPAAAEVGGLPTYHIVKKGECLWRISEYEEIYNDPFQWPLIYKENRSKIKDPDLIYPEQNFDVPRDSTESEVAEAVREAKFRGAWSLWDGK
jgi:nucleoid-associated protein YgaU